MDYSQEYFTIESLESGNTITLTIKADVGTADVAWIAWSKDKTNWTTTNNVDNQAVTITVSVGLNEKVYLKGSGKQLCTNASSSSTQTNFSSTKNFIIYGNIASLLFGDNFENVTEFPSGSTLNFACLFFGINKLKNIDNLILPFTTLTTRCYTSLFRGIGVTSCNLMLPATTIASNSYENMFRDCSSLTTPPKMYVTSFIGTNNMQYMFSGCSSLAEAPELPATSTALACYQYMFQNCTSLTKAPVLPAKTLANYSYRNMFNGCTNLQEVTCLATDISATDCLTNWLNNVKATGTFYKNPNMSSFPSGASGIPSGWTTEAANTFTYNGHYPDNITLNGTPLSYLKVNGSQVWRKIN